MLLRTSMAVLALLISSAAGGHDPIFGLGPHTLYQGGIEVALQLHLEKNSDEKETELGLELVYGVTGDWAVGLEAPYVWKKEGADRASGAEDLDLFTKYRYWRHDRLGIQESAAVLLKVKTDTGDAHSSPALGTGTTDTIVGLTYGYESRKWYRWFSLRYSRNGESDTKLRRGDKLLFDLVGGIRPQLTGYLEPDTVWLLELNGEYSQRAEMNGNKQPHTGGTQWFLSPGIFWTQRNFAIKAGVQIPIASMLNGDQEETDYRAKLVLEWHL